MRGAERRYRPDIDGLRAVAVILVILFHLKVPQVPGGFIGVDVFFVISGYLLTGIIAKEMDASAFSIAGFYERRARRILPALIGVLVATTVLAFFFLMPGELVAYAKSLLGATFSYSNIYFWSTADYFDAPAQSKPLLHTWSLAVEEQFYIVLPLLLLLFARRWGRARNGTIVLLAATSFAWSVWCSHAAPVSAFYLPFSRAWELLAGSILALGIIPSMTRPWVRETAAFAGIALIVGGAWKLTSSTAFPGVAALVPCGGSLLVIAAGRHGPSVVARMLSLRPIVFIGLISYSVYLWHWPLIVFSGMGFLPILPGRLSIPLIVFLSLGLGWLSWQFIEKPFRVGAFRKLPRTRVFGSAATGMAICAAVALVFIATRGLPVRFPSNAVKIADLVNIPQETQNGKCFITTKSHFEDFRIDRCMQPDATKKNYLLLGDSHAAALWYGLTRELPGTHIMQANVSGCAPGIDASGSRDCRRMMEYVFGTFLATHRVDAVFLTARWWDAQEFKHMQKTIAWLAQRKIDAVIFGPVMEYDTALPKLLAYSLVYRDPGLPERHARPVLFAMDKTMQLTALHEWHVPYISLIDVQCPSGHCMGYADPAHTIALMGDDNHLSNAGSMLIVRKLRSNGELPPHLTQANAARRDLEWSNAMFFRR